MVRKDIKEFIKTIPDNVTIVAATKYVGVDDLKILLKSGINNFGENRVEDFLNKYRSLQNNGVLWHFIGHLQRNKAKDVVNKIDYLHSLDSLKLAKIIDENRTTPLNTFIEVSINGEENKNGVLLPEIFDFVKEIKQYKNIHLVGLMMMAVKGSGDNSLDEQFAKLRKLRDQLEKDFNLSLPYLSMGMSDDYIEAIKEGATHIRLGRILFDLK